MQYILTNIATLAQTAPAGDLPAFLIGLANSDLADLSWVDPALGLTGLGYWPVSATDASAITGTMVGSGANTYTVNAAAKSWTMVLGARAMTAAETTAQAKAQAQITLDSTDAKMPRAYEDLLTAIKAQQPAMYAALPSFTQTMHDQRIAARAALLGA